MMMKEIVKKAVETHNLTKDEIIELLSNDNEKDELFDAADKLRRLYKGEGVHLRGLIEFSNYCRQNCMYCGIRRDNKELQRYRLEPERIIELATSAVLTGYKTIVLQSGEDPWYTTDKMCHIIKEVKKTDAAITISIGECNLEDYRAFKNAGADRFLLKVETSDRELYKNLHPGMDYDNRIECIRNLKRAGFETGTGCLIGLPGQTLESLAKDILFFKELDADMIGVGPFIPHRDTPLSGSMGGTLTLAVKVMAIVRLLLPDINIPATTSMETVNPMGRIMALCAGANAIMPNVGDYEYKRLYSIYPGKSHINDDIDKTRERIIRMIESIGRFVSEDYGYRK